MHARASHARDWKVNRASTWKSIPCTSCTFAYNHPRLFLVQYFLNVSFGIPLLCKKSLAEAKHVDVGPRKFTYMCSSYMCANIHASVIQHARKTILTPSMILGCHTHATVCIHITSCTGVKCASWAQDHARCFLMQQKTTTKASAMHMRNGPHKNTSKCVHLHIRANNGNTLKTMN